MAPRSKAKKPAAETQKKRSNTKRPAQKGGKRSSRGAEPTPPPAESPQGGSAPITVEELTQMANLEVAAFDIQCNSGPESVELRRGNMIQLFPPAIGNQPIGDDDYWVGKITGISQITRAGQTKIILEVRLFFLQSQVDELFSEGGSHPSAQHRGLVQEAKERQLVLTDEHIYVETCTYAGEATDIYHALEIRGLFLSPEERIKGVRNLGPLTVTEVARTPAHSATIRTTAAELIGFVPPGA